MSCCIGELPDPVSGFSDIGGATETLIAVCMAIPCRYHQRIQCPFLADRLGSAAVWDALISSIRARVIRARQASARCSERSRDMPCAKGSRRHCASRYARQARFAMRAAASRSFRYAVLLAAAAYQVADADGHRWIYSIGAAIFFLTAFASLVRADTAKVIVTDGEEWIRRINDSVAPAETHSRDGAPDSAAGPR
jgi:hypothetical protein